ncbi:thiol:disulfide interchange protein [Sphingomonas sp. Leaf339]|uniref:protein-disulfide reductase DsbD family protein n=1 Tax=Sphingomonas sp. Leaf339 TaxID=1736343 RepID=UPI0006FFFA76|nr:protein-disulfide reductase DsbD domain-containing protein [Sphingomonas sp. Leaf339]KQU49672.1 thiol:disulfide interchange protein [Sphingomonas sp. Leaf339]
MRLLRVVMMTMVMWLAGLSPALAQNGGRAGPHLAMQLVAESERPKAGDTVTLALATTPAAGWHGYWSNPGDAGFPATFGWTLPKGVTAETPAWPVPETLVVAGLMNYVYERPYAPLVKLRVPAGLAAGTVLPIGLKLDYLVCTRTVCVPEQQTLATTLTVGGGTVGDGAVAPATRARFDAWRQAIPRPLDTPATWAVKDGALKVAVPYPADAALAEPYLFPTAPGSIEGAAPQTVVRVGDQLVVTTKGTPAGPFEAVLRIGDGRGLAIKAQAGVVPDAGGAGGAGQPWVVAALLAFAGAVIGGLILNVMPCVFPILSLKALSLARANVAEREARREALAYTAGVVLVCLGLGAVILGLRAGGATVGWAFQLQDPRVVVVLLLLSVAIALNLSGLFEMPMPRWAGEAGSGGSFATGALAAFVATPCSGPFMGAALGAALVLPVPAALAVFAGLGLGLALPFLLLGFVPRLRKRLPKPGAWMARLRRILSVPMWLTALALVWVLGRQAGVDGMTLGLGAALVAALALWAGGRRQMAGLSLGWTLVPVAASLGVAALVQPVAATPSAAAGEAFSEVRLAALRAEGRPVFAYFTADWCLTCKVNEKAAIDRAGVQAAFAKNKVAVLIGDWTDGDPVLGRFIERHNRAGVPLYLYYAPGAKEARVLPQVLTTGMLEELGG